MADAHVRAGARRDRLRAELDGVAQFDGRGGDAGGITIVKRTNGQDQRFPIERSGRPIPSEPGSLFLDTGNPGPSGSPAREILDIRCVD